MKRLLLLSILALTFTIKSLAQSLPSYVPTSNLVGFWSLNGNSNDISGNNNNGTLVGNITYETDRNGNPNSSLKINNGADLMCTSNSFSNPNPFSISFWFKTPSNASGQQLIGFNNGQCVHGGVWDRAVLITATTFGIYLHSNGTNNFITAPANFMDNIWRHCVVTLSSSGLNIYINGTLFLTNPINSAENNTGYWRIGGLSPNDANNSSTSFIDELGIWHKALSQQEITNLYNAQSNVPAYLPTNGLVGWWPFSGNAFDSSGNGNNGTVNGATVTTDRFGNAGKAYSFDGVSNIIINNNQVFNQGPLSISLWLKVNTIGFYDIISKDGLTNNPNPRQWTIQANMTQPRFGVFSNNGEFTIDGDLNSITNQHWAHIVGVYTNSHVMIYFNSILVHDTIITGTLVTGQELLKFGGNLIPSSFLLGKLDDIGIWNRALTQQEITNLYNAQNPCANLSTNFFTQDTLAACGISTTLTAPANYSYAWSTNDTTQTINATQTGWYKCTVSNSSGCSATDSLFIRHNYYVDTLGNDTNSGCDLSPLRHIQTAINLSHNGDSIFVNKGRYHENILISNKNIVITSKQYISNDSNDVVNTIIDGDSITNAVILNNFNGVFNGFTIEHGYSNYGAGLKVVASNTPIVRNCIIQHNVGYGDITAHGVDFEASNGIIEFCKIRYNFGRKHTVQIFGNSIFRNSIVTNNTAWEESNVVTWSTTQLYNLIICNNIGGGLKINQGAQNAKISNLTVVNNTGFGVLVWGLNTSQNTEASISNSIIWGNTPSNILLWQSSTPATTKLNLDYSIVQGGDSGVVTNLYNILNYGTHNINKNPLFISQNDYRLQKISPAINNGIDSITLGQVTINSPSNDYYNNFRPSPVGTRPDMGAIESEYGCFSNQSNYLFSNDSIYICDDTYALSLPNTYNDYLWNTGNTSNSIITTQKAWYSCIATQGFCAIKDSVFINPDKPNAIVSTQQTAICPNGSTTLTAAGGATYLWSNGDTSATTTVSQAGNYYVVANNQYGCSDTSNTVSITQKAMPTSVKVKYDGPSIVCEPNTVKYILDMPLGSTTGFGYQWYLSGTAITGATDSVYQASNSGLYSVSVIGGNSCVKASVGKPSIVNAKPIAAFTAVGPTTICSGNLVTFSAPSILGYSYTWLKDGVAAGSGISKTFKLAGNYTVVAKLNGCTDTASPIIPIVVNPLPIAAISALSPATFCAGDSCTLSATPIGMTNYKWYSGNNLLASTNNATQKVGIAGTMKVMVTDPNACVSKVSSTNVKTKVSPIPVATISVSGTNQLSATGFVKLKASPTLADAYQWYKDGQILTGATNNIYITSVGGNFTANVTKLGCTGVSNTITIASVSPKEQQEMVQYIDEQFELAAYPNPVTNLLTINVRGIEEVNATIQVMDFNGRLVAMKAMTTTSTTVDMTGYASGMYLIRYKDAEGRTGTIKITKE